MVKKKVQTYGSYDGKDIIDISVIIKNTGDGLSKSLEIEPRDLHIGDTIDVLLRCKVDEVKHRAIKDNVEQVELINVLKAGVATIIDADISDELINAQQDKLDKAAGKQKIPFGAGEQPDA